MNDILVFVIICCLTSLIKAFVIFNWIRYKEIAQFIWPNVSIYGIILKESYSISEAVNKIAS